MCIWDARGVHVMCTWVARGMHVVCTTCARVSKCDERLGARGTCAASSGVCMRPPMRRGYGCLVVDEGRSTKRWRCSTCCAWSGARGTVCMCLFARVAFGGAVQGLPWWHGFCSSMQLFACMPYFTTWLLEHGARRVAWNFPPTELWEDVVSDEYSVTNGRPARVAARV